MHTGTDLRVVGEEHRTHTVARAMSEGGLHPRILTLNHALRRPGSVLGADIVVWCFPPWSHPMPEAEAYASGSIGLYAHWGSSTARIGPVTLLGSGPCPRCVGGRRVVAPKGESQLLAAWVAAWAALQCDSLLRTETTELIGASWGWSLDAASLAPLSHPRDGACRLPGCGGR